MSDLILPKIHYNARFNAPFVQTIEQLQRPLVLPYPDGFFDVLEVDWPWHYKDRGMNGFEDVQKWRVHPSYVTQTITWMIDSLPEIQRVMADDYCAWLWWTKDFLQDCFALLDHLLLDFKQIVPWIKTKKGSEYDDEGFPVGASDFHQGGLGRFYGRNAVEGMLYAVTGPGIHWAAGSSTPNWVFAPKQKSHLGRDHSCKPDKAYELIANNSPGRRLSLFQITPRPGFFCFGNDLPDYYNWQTALQFGDWR